MLQRDQFHLDRVLLAFKLCLRGTERGSKQFAVFSGVYKRGEQIPDDGATETGVKKLLDLADEGFVLGRIDALAGRGSQWGEKSLLLVVTERAHAHPGPVCKLTNSHVLILAHMDRP